MELGGAANPILISAAPAAESGATTESAVAAATAAFTNRMCVILP
jgi:hypothetical protein